MCFWGFLRAGVVISVSALPVFQPILRSRVAVAVHPWEGGGWQWAAPGVIRKGPGVGGEIQLHLRRFIPRHKIIKRGMWGDNVDWVKSGLGSVPLATRDRQEVIWCGEPGLSTWILVIKRTLNVFDKVSWKQNVLIKHKWETCSQTLASKEEWGYFSVFGPWVGSVRLK